MLILSILLETAAAGALLLPVFLLLNKFLIHDMKCTAAFFIFTLYLAAVWNLVGLPNITYIRFHLHVNLIPFADMMVDFSTLLNILLFVPLGFFLPLLWSDFRSVKKTVLWGLFTSLSIELLQIFTFRSTDINDLITNTLGTAIGWLLAISLLKKYPFMGCDKAERAVTQLYGLVFVIMFFIQPFLSGFFWNLIY